MPDSQSFSIGVDRLLQEVRPYGRTVSCYPRNLDDVQARRAPGESLHQWFVRLVNQFCGGEPKLVALEDNLAVFVRLAWTRRGQLSCANIQTLVTDCDLDDYYLEAAGQAVYLRLDFRRNGVGSRFRTSTNDMEHAFSENDSRPPPAGFHA